MFSSSSTSIIVVGPFSRPRALDDGADPRLWMRPMMVRNPPNPIFRPTSWPSADELAFAPVWRFVRPDVIQWIELTVPVRSLTTGGQWSLPGSSSW